jgi:hypothetical protein
MKLERLIWVGILSLILMFWIAQIAASNGVTFDDPSMAPPPEIRFDLPPDNLVRSYVTARYGMGFMLTVADKTVANYGGGIAGIPPLGPEPDPTVDYSRFLTWEHPTAAPTRYIYIRVFDHLGDEPGHNDTHWPRLPVLLEHRCRAREDARYVMKLGYFFRGPDERCEWLDRWAMPDNTGLCTFKVPVVTGTYADSTGWFAWTMQTVWVNGVSMRVPYWKEIPNSRLLAGDVTDTLKWENVTGVSGGGAVIACRRSAPCSEQDPRCAEFGLCQPDSI